MVIILISQLVSKGTHSKDQSQHNQIGHSSSHIFKEYKYNCDNICK